VLLIFDCDGVLIDSMALHNQVESDAYRELGIFIAPQELGRRFAGVPTQESLKILERETGIKIPADTAVLLDKKKSEVFERELRVVDGIHETLDELEGLPRCVASGSSVHGLDHSLKITDLYARFAPHIYSSDMTPRGKPHPDLFLYAAEKIKAPPKECLVIEDAVAGVVAAKAAGMRAFGFIGGSHCTESHPDSLLAAGAERVFSKMRDLPSLIRQQ
jgi:HAD superfamily hydrolase (TIGR01509 family)